MDIQDRIWITWPTSLYQPGAHDVEEEYPLGKQLNRAWMLQ